MAIKRVSYQKKAATFKEQIDNLKRHGVIISDEKKAMEYLADIGYYRLGFYLHPFEITYPDLESTRKHDVKPETKIEDVVALYYYDFDLRNILNRYLSRIEVAIRSTLLNEISIKYRNNPTWFIDPNVVTRKFITEFPTAAYNTIKKNDPIKRHHKKYTGHYAPAWKTMEYMTLGNLETLYSNLLLENDKKLVSNRFGEPATATFKSYLSAVRELRNACAHGKPVFDLRLYNGIRNGKAGAFQNPRRHTFKEALAVVDYLLKNISVNRQSDMWEEIHNATRRFYKKAPYIRPIIENETGINVPTSNFISLWINRISKKS